MSTLALQNNCQVIASASGSPAHDVSDASSSDDLHLPNVVSHVMLWDVSSCTCRKVLRQSCHQITCLAFSRDDRFLVAMSERHRPPFTPLPILPSATLTSSSRFRRLPGLHTERVVDGQVRDRLRNDDVASDARACVGPALLQRVRDVRRRRGGRVLAARRDNSDFRHRCRQLRRFSTEPREAERARDAAASARHPAESQGSCMDLHIIIL